MPHTKKQWLIAGAIVALFLLFRIPGIGQIYHQDEYRWATIVNPAFDESSGSHPPMTRWVLSAYGYVFGYDTLRVVPLMFSLAGLVLVYIVSLRVSESRRTAVIASILYAINTYSVIASLQIDIDGAILPFFTLFTWLAYASYKDGSKKGSWLLALAIVGGLLTKLSYVLCLAAMATDWGIGFFGSQRISWKKVRQKALVYLPWLILTFIFAYLLLAEQFAPVFKYASGFKSLDFAERAYGDLGFKIAKSLMFAGPLLLFAGLLGLLDRKLREKYRFWCLYLGFNLLFYLVLFDFAKLTIERYFMFLIIPLCLIGAETISKLTDGVRWTMDSLMSIPKKSWLMAGIGAYLLLLILTIPHDTLPLNPKGAYIDRIESLQLNFLIPFTGGSGPVGFYFSAFFVAAVFALMAIKAWLSAGDYRWKDFAAICFVWLGVLYSLLFNIEYLSGFLYGSVPRIAHDATEYVKNTTGIKEVITYYDIGAYDLRLSGKYSARFYTAPSRNYTGRITDYRGHYMIVDFPRVGTDNQYWKLISRCPLERQFTDGHVDAYIFDCTKLSP